jgi:microsomal epoxide hydrolase
MQSTRPQTLAYALTDSPLGQLAWIVERFEDWTDSVDVPEDAVDRDLMLTNVMIYWLFGTAGSAARYSKEGAAYWDKLDPVSTVTTVAVMPRDIHWPVRQIAEQSNRIVQWTELPRGGHFAPMGELDLIVDDSSPSGSSVPRGYSTFAVLLVHDRPRVRTSRRQHCCVA